MTLLPVRSTTVAPSGAFTRAASPMSAMRPSRRTIVWRSRGGAPVPSMTRTLVSATTDASIVMKLRTALLNCGGWPDSATDVATSIAAIGGYRRMEYAIICHMKRTTIFVPEALERDLQLYAIREGRAAASIVREAVAEYLARRQDVRLPSFTGAFESGRSDIAERHEALLFDRLSPHGDEAPINKPVRPARMGVTRRRRTR